MYKKYNKKLVATNIDVQGQNNTPCKKQIAIFYFAQFFLTLFYIFIKLIERLKVAAF
jgi:hypothetical protein